MRISRDRMADWNIEESRKGLSELIPFRDYEGLNEQSEQLRIWLPEPAKIALEEIAERAESSMTVYLTEFFTAYLYGQHELQRMRESRSGLYEPPRTRYSRMSTEAEGSPNLGKNIYALKIFVSKKLKVELQQLAQRVNMTLGEYCRGLICAHLFGQVFGPKNVFELASVEEDAAAAWEAEAR
jgi:hypothetical protein